MTAGPGLIEQVAGTDKTFRVGLENLDLGLNTRAYPHTLGDRFLSKADNAVFLRDGLVSKRPGNRYYGGSVNGKVGTGTPILSMGRYYPPAGSPQLVVHSGNNLYTGNDSTGAFTLIDSSMPTNQRAAFTQMYDPDMQVSGVGSPAAALFVCDGTRVPHLWDGTHFVPVQTGGVFLPNGATGSPITPSLVCDWGYHLVYAGEPTEPTGLYISDAMRPERFTGTSYIDSGATSYIPYFPAGRDGTMGVITAVVPLGAALIIFYTNGIVLAENTGSVDAFEFRFTVLSRTVGCTSPKSVVPFDSFVVFFGGDRFYATNGQQLQPLPDRVPTIYARNSQSSAPPEIYDITQVVAVRRNTQYIASYTIDGAGQTRHCAVFDTAAGGGYVFGFFPRGYDETNGGAWSRWLGMNMNAAVDCRGPGDTYQMYWGASDGDYVAEHDPVQLLGSKSDFGNAIAFEVCARAFTMDKLFAPKFVTGMYLIMVYDVPASGQYTSTITPYVLRDQTQDTAPSIPVTVTQQGITYGSQQYGTFTYQTTNAVVQATLKAYPQQPTGANSIAPGLIETSTHPCNLIGFALEVTVDDPY